MQSSIFVSTAAQRVAQTQLVTIANNIANTNTVGFRAESVDFKSLISKTGNDPVHFPTVSKIHSSDTQGTLTETGNPLDVALSGKGWFALQTPAGVAYTRDGRIAMTPFGELRSVNGHAILDAGNAPIQLNPNGPTPEIASDGRIFQNGLQIANIGVFELDQSNFTSRYENSSFFSKIPGVPIVAGGTTSILQGHTESSNVNPMYELAKLISVTRSFEQAASTIEKADQTIGSAIRTLGSNG
ncbi:MAG: flagellar basal-body rod protein FlgF [Rhizobiaceae bacterium]